MNKREAAHKLIDDLFDDYPEEEIAVCEQIEYDVGPVPRTYTIEVTRDIKPEEVKEFMSTHSGNDTGCTHERQ